MTAGQLARTARRNRWRFNLSSMLPTAKRPMTLKKEIVYTPARISMLPREMKTIEQQSRKNPPMM
jgi:hypothetical protein